LLERDDLAALLAQVEAGRWYPNAAASILSGLILSRMRVPLLVAGGVLLVLVFVVRYALRRRRRRRAARLGA
jgi:hypothetical protein